MNLVSRLLISRQLKWQFYRWDRATLRRHQAKRVATILAFAQQHSPYYRRVIVSPADLARLPTMNKAEMMAHFDDINTAGLRRDELVEFRIEQERAGTIGLFRAEYSVGLSSGTSGSRGLVVLSRAERQLYGCLLWARSGLPKGLRRRRVLFALRTNNPALMEPRLFGVELVYVDYSHPPEALVSLINAKQLNILAGPPSLLRLLAQQREAIAHPIDCLISYAEVLDDSVRTELQQAFAGPVIEIYQGAEGFIGSTCRCGKLHINEDAVLVEGTALSEAGDGAITAVVTDLYRTTQPLIRYSLGDVLDLDPQPCECGSCFRVIRRIHGRADDLFLAKGLGGETRHLFPDYVVRSINQASDAILEFQAIQHALDCIEIRLALKPGAERGPIEAKVRENLDWRAKHAGVELGRVWFSGQPPERNPRSHKLIRVIRKF